MPACASEQSRGTEIGVTASATMSFVDSAGNVFTFKAGAVQASKLLSSVAAPTASEKPMRLPFSRAALIAWQSQRREVQRNTSREDHLEDAITIAQVQHLRSHTI